MNNCTSKKHAQWLKTKSDFYPQVHQPYPLRQQPKF